MLALKKALQNSSPKSVNRRIKTTSIPLRPIYNVPAPVVPAEIWFMILELDYPECILCRHTLLCTLSLVCRVFHEFASKALYQTLDLRFSKCNESHPWFNRRGFHRSPKPHTKFDLLKKKLDRLDRTLRLPQGPVLLVRHLRLPDVKIRKYSSNVGDILNLLPNWVMIFELCSSRLESVAGLGNLWTYLYNFDRPELREQLCNAIENNPHWTQWDWCEASWGYASWSVLAEEPRILETYRRWENIQHVSLDNAEWAANVLGSTPELCSLSIKCANRICEFSTIFQHVPVKGLRSLSVEAWVPPQTLPAKFDNTEPLYPLIDYLERCRLQPASSQYLNLSTLTNLDISCLWGRNNFHSGIFYAPKMACFNEFLFSILTLASSLRELKIEFRTYHESEIKLPVAPDHAFELMAHKITDFVARHLQSMTISIPARNSKTWLANKIASGVFPNLSSFIFRSAMTRRELSYTRMFCACTLDSSSEFLALNDFGREQDAALVRACQQAGVRDWEMQILHVDQVCCVALHLWKILSSLSSPS